MAADTTLAGLVALDLGEAPAGGSRDRAARAWAAAWPKLAARVTDRLREEMSPDGR